MQLFNIQPSKTINKVYPFLLGSTLCLSFPPHAISFIVFITLALFLFELENGSRSKFWLGYLFYLGAVVAFIGYWFSYYFRTQLDTGYVLSYLLTSIICLYTALYIGIISAIYVKIKTKSTLFNLVGLFPSLWVLTELIRGFWFPRSWYALGNTQVDNILFRGFYPLFGVYFVTWLVVSISGFIVWGYLNSKTRKVKIIFILVTTCFIISALILSQISYTKPYGKSISVALVQPSEFSTQDFTQEDLLVIEDISKKLVEGVRADLIVLPETVFSVDYHYLTPGYLSELQQIALDKNAVLIFGSPIVFGSKPHQTGILNIMDLNNPVYLKYYLVPFGEYDPLQQTIFEPIIKQIGMSLSDYVAGEFNQKPYNILGQSFSFNICYENTINDYVAKNAKNSTILLNQSDLSWYGRTVMKDSSLQFSQARALENQKYFLQDGNTGDTVIINPKGQIEKSIPAFKPGVVSASVQGYTGSTPFDIWTNIPIWLLCLGSLLSAIYLKYFKK